VTFEEIPDWYWGVHKEEKYGEPYLGSPKTHKWKWEFYTPHLQICEFFPYTDEGWTQARKIEDSCILPDLNNPLCLNEHVGGLMSLETSRKGGKNGGGKGDKEAQRRNGLSAKDNKKGFHAPGMNSKGGKTTQQRHPNHSSEAGKLGAVTQHKQLWRCLVTGHITTPAPLSRYQKARGIDTNLRERVK